jgi:hypothetical protein
MGLGGIWTLIEKQTGERWTDKTGLLQTKAQLALKRCKQFELGYVFLLSIAHPVAKFGFGLRWIQANLLCSGDKKTKGAALVF